MKLWKLFKTLSGIRLEFKGRSDESLKFIPYLLMILNGTLTILWVSLANYHEDHIFTEGGTNAYEFICSESKYDSGFFWLLFAFNVIIYAYAVFLSYILRSNKIFTKQSRYANIILYNSLGFLILAACFSTASIFNHTTRKIILSILMFMGTNGLLLLLRHDIEKPQKEQSQKPKSSEKSRSIKVGSQHDMIDRSTLGSMVKLNSNQTNDTAIFYDYVEVLDKKLKINVWKRFFLLFNGTDKYFSLHTIKKVSSNNEYQLKSEGIVYKMDFLQKPVLIEELERKNKIKIQLDNNITLTIVFSSEEMVRKFKILMNLCMANIRAKFAKQGPGLGLINSFHSVRSNEDLRKKQMIKKGSMDELKKPANLSATKSLEDLKRQRNL
eukprot:NODE_309_length_10065_cov_0.706101.p4 type:complete len:382 gc:universal NODE_309_length_10065_cov_0.706101:3573-2428(-)